LPLETKNEEERDKCLVMFDSAFHRLSFRALMFYFAFISTENARRHYQAKKLEKSIQGISQQSAMPKMPDFTNSKRTPTPTPMPKPEKDWRKNVGDYEIGSPMLALPALIFGLWLASIAFGTLPARNPLGLSDLTRRSILAMTCSFVISPALLILYIWALRMGFIG